MPDSRYCQLFREFEHRLSPSMRQTDVAIVDAGAHHGRLTLPLAQLPASLVVAFEPVPAAFACLQQAMSAAWGGEVPPHVTLRRGALAERSGTTTIAAPRINGILQEEWASISKDYAALRQADPRIEAIETWSVPMLCLDDAGLTGVSAIKIDVEGAELMHPSRRVWHRPFSARVNRLRHNNDWLQQVCLD